jgi:hypothetical protein
MQCPKRTWTIPIIYYATLFFKLLCKAFMALLFLSSSKDGPHMSIF